MSADIDVLEQARLIVAAYTDSHGQLLGGEELQATARALHPSRPPATPTPAPPQAVYDLAADIPDVEPAPANAEPSPGEIVIWILVVAGTAAALAALAVAAGIVAIARRILR